MTTKRKLEILEKIQAIYTPGVEFIPVNSEGVLASKSYTVKEDWNIAYCTTNHGFNVWFSNHLGVSAHIFNIYQNGHWAQVIASIEEKLINPINNSENEKHTSTEIRAAIIQSSNFKIGQGSISRGVGLKGSISKIRLGSYSSNYQERLSYC